MKWLIPVINGMKTREDCNASKSIFHKKNGLEPSAQHDKLKTTWPLITIYCPVTYQPHRRPQRFLLAWRTSEILLVWRTSEMRIYNKINTNSL